MYFIAERMYFRVKGLFALYLYSHFCLKKSIIDPSALRKAHLLQHTGECLKSHCPQQLVHLCKARLLAALLQSWTLELLQFMILVQNYKEKKQTKNPNTENKSPQLVSM